MEQRSQIFKDAEAKANAALADTKAEITATKAEITATKAERDKHKPGSDLYQKEDARVDLYFGFLAQQQKTSADAMAELVTYRTKTVDAAPAVDVEFFGYPVPVSTTQLQFIIGATTGLAFIGVCHGTWVRVRFQYGVPFPYTEAKFARMKGLHAGLKDLDFKKHADFNVVALAKDTGKAAFLGCVNYVGFWKRKGGNGGGKP